jgi:hypothetical protein
MGAVMTTAARTSVAIALGRRLDMTDLLDVRRECVPRAGRFPVIFVLGPRACSLATA